MSPAITLALSHSPFHSGVMVLAISGFIDAASAPDLEAHLERLIAAGQGRLLVDLRNVTYVGSAGIGVLLGHIKEIRELPDGDLKIVHASPKIRRVFDSIGLPDMLDVLEEEHEVQPWTPRGLEPSLHHFSVTMMDPVVVCGQDARLRVEARDSAGRTLTDFTGEPRLEVSRGLVVPRALIGFRQGTWEGTMIVTDAGPLTLRVREEDVETAVEMEAGEPPGRPVFPRTVACRQCGSAARAKGTDIYRCHACNAIFYVDAWAQVIPLQAGASKRPQTRSRGLDLKMNGDINYLRAFRAMLADICEQEGLTESQANEVVLAVEEALLNIIEHGYAYDSSHAVGVQVRFQRGDLVVKIRDQGEPYDLTQSGLRSVKACIERGRKGGVGTLLIHQLMDSLDYRSTSRYNQLIMRKRLPRPGRRSGSGTG